MSAGLPAERVVPDVRARIRADHRATGRRIAVLDDDPTGSQSVHGVSAVLGLDPAPVATALAAAGSTCFVLTNTRAVPRPVAVRVTRRVGTDLLALGPRLGGPVTLVSRSDSTLRGHLVAEVGALREARRAVTGRDHDGVLLVPAYVEAGRTTVGLVHRARVGGRDVPVGETEFARDATFGYRSSHLGDLIAELTGGRVARDDVLGVTLADIREGGPERVAGILAGARDGRFVAVDATGYPDLEVVALGLLEAERRGLSFLLRTGPSFVRALAGIEPRGPLTGAELAGPGPAGAGPAGAGPAGGHGLVVVGSHVGLTNLQLEGLRRLGGVAELTLDVRAVLAGGAARDAHVAGVAARARAELARRDVLLVTSRELVTGVDGAASLRTARTVSRALTDAVAAVLPARPGWVVAKGGITSHDVATRALRIRRAVVVGQLLPGMVSVLRAEDADERALGMPFVVFAGNVGDGRTLADVVARVRGVRSRPAAPPRHVQRPGTPSAT